jgi:hypothetical protein
LQQSQETRDRARSPEDGPIIAMPTLRGAPLLAGPDRLAGLGFRYWMTGYQTGDINCWEECWNLHAATLGNALARRVVSDLSCWVRCMASLAQRDIEVYPGPCRMFCRDECSAVMIVAALQQGSCPAIAACVRALLATDECEDVLNHGRIYARTLHEAGQELGCG